MEGNLNQFMSLHSEQEAAEEHRNQPSGVRDGYLSDDEGESGDEDEDEQKHGDSSSRGCRSRENTLPPIRESSDSSSTIRLPDGPPDPESMVGAIKSLEKTISNHCNVLNRRMRRPLLSSNSTAARSPGMMPPAPKTTARTEMVSENNDLSSGCTSNHS